MLKPGALVLVAVTGAAWPASDAQADSQRRGWNVIAGVHGMSAKSELGEGGTSSIGSPVMVGLRLWQALGERMRLEGELPLGATDSRDHLATLFFTMPRMHARYFPIGKAPLTPSLVLGGGVPIVTSNKQSSVETDVLGSAYAGAGVEFRLRRIIMGVEARYLAIPARESGLAHEWEVLLSFGLGPKKQKKRKPRPLRPSDSDGDGVPDSVDQCLSRQEDRDDFEDEDGCPELDNDKDGVIDGLDECAREAETFNGFEDDDGCYDELIEEVRLLEGVISGLRFDEGSGVMEEKGQEEFESLVEILRNHPSVKVDVVGHTDDAEVPPEEREALSRERADSVLQLLVEMGIGHGRIFSFGLGDTEPFADNSSSRGRKTNRRVEIRIHKEDPRESSAPPTRPAPKPKKQRIPKAVDPLAPVEPDPEALEEPSPPSD